MRDLAAGGAPGGCLGPGAAGESLAANGAAGESGAVCGVPADLRGYAADGGHLVFDVRVGESPAAPLYLAVHDDYPAQPGVCLNERLAGCRRGVWATLAVPLAEVESAGSDLRHVDVPFMLYTEGTGKLDIRRIRWEC